MGYALVIGSCCACGKPFSFNPVRVPSARDSTGERQPICKGCVDRANPERIAKGLPPITYAADAYTFCDEGEL
ncbi:hypothetical protein LCGC14_1750780 [marine sediment metagenome]|uniref:Uncharacterized protein n=1 Tax=marine sediment metagenome TaxID=412755 RepID=A0A0F9K3I3_9ZZZZ